MRVLFVCSRNTDRSADLLDIPDDFDYMDPTLIRLLETKAGPFFSRVGSAPNNSRERTLEE
jgi:predicted protein tyrosine phosphatase